MFKNRSDAGLQLAEELLCYIDQEVVVLAIPRGGLPLGAIVASKLGASLDIVLTKKIGHPFNREYAIGAVSLDSVILTKAKEATREYIEIETKRIREVLSKRYHQYYEHTEPHDIKDKVVIIIDDGIATGNTILATIELIYKKKPAHIIVAVPVAPIPVIKKLKTMPQVDAVICLQTPFDFRSVGQFYKDFCSVSHKKAVQLLEACNQNVNS